MNSRSPIYCSAPCLTGTRCCRLESKAEAIALLQSEIKLVDIIEDFAYSLSNKSLHMLPEYAIKLQVLKESDFVTDDEVRIAM